MARYDRAFKNLAKPENAAINRLLGPILLKVAAEQNQPHFFLDALDRNRQPYLASWNYWIMEYINAMLNPDDAPRKVLDELKDIKSDAQSKLLSVLSEVLAVCTLKTEGYKKFEVLLKTDRKTPDFTAYRRGKRVKVEVKALEPPKDRINIVVQERWQKNREKDPSRYAFRAMLTHSTTGKITDAAINRLRTLIDQLPDIRRNPIIETLDGGVRVQIEKEVNGKFSTDETPAPIKGWILGRDRKEGTLIVRTTIGIDHLNFNVGAFQAFFLKVFRSTANATTQVLGDDGDGGLENVIALVWHPPDPMIDTQLPDISQKKLQRLFSSLGLKTKIRIIYKRPEVPVKILRDSVGRGTGNY